MVSGECSESIAASCKGEYNSIAGGWLLHPCTPRQWQRSPSQQTIPRVPFKPMCYYPSCRLRFFVVPQEEEVQMERHGSGGESEYKVYPQTSFHLFSLLLDGSEFLGCDARSPDVWPSPEGAPSPRGILLWLSTKLVSWQDTTCFAALLTLVTVNEKLAPK